jgi:regulator of replication initiation timing
MLIIVPCVGGDYEVMLALIDEIERLKGEENRLIEENSRLKTELEIYKSENSELKNQLNRASKTQCKVDFSKLSYSELCEFLEKYDQ